MALPPQEKPVDGKPYKYTSYQASMPKRVEVLTPWGPINDIGAPWIVNILLPGLAPGVVANFSSSLEILVVLGASLEDGGRLVGAIRAGHEPPGNIPAAVLTLDKTEAPVRTLRAPANYVSLMAQTVRGRRRTAVVIL